MICAWKSVMYCFCSARWQALCSDNPYTVSSPLKWEDNNKHKFEHQVVFPVACHFLSDQCLYERFNHCYYHMWPFTSLLHFTFCSTFYYALTGQHYYFSASLHFGLTIIRMRFKISEYLARNTYRYYTDILDTIMKTIGSMGLCPAGCNKWDPQLKLACNLCTRALSKHDNTGVTGSLGALQLGPHWRNSFLQIRYLLLPWPLQGIYKIWGRLLLPCIHVQKRDRPNQFKNHLSYKALSGNNKSNILSSVCENKDLHKWVSTVHHFDKWDSKNFGDIPWFENLVPLF